MRIISMMMIVGRIEGMVIFHIICQRDAPSTTALSYSVGDTPAMAARNTIDENPASCQIVVPTKIGRNHSGLVRK